MVRIAITSLLMLTLVMVYGHPLAQTASGVGARKCSAFSVAVEKDSSEALNAYVSWAQGFISGYNWANNQRDDIRIDPAAMINALSQLCAANPTARIHTAVGKLIELNRR